MRIGATLFSPEGLQPVMLLVKYGEIALKSQSVRRRFEQQLLQNIQKRLLEERIEAAMEFERGVMLIRTSRTEALESILSKTFGVIYYSRAVESTSLVEEIEHEAVALASHFPSGTSFAVRCKRSGSHPYTSMELAAKVGSAIFTSHGGLRIDLTRPDNILWIEVRNKKSHIYTKRAKGPGGMPVGTQGRALLMVPKGMEREAAMAGWLVLKRGVSLYISLENGARSIVPILEPWGGPRDCMEGLGLDEAMLAARAAAVVLPNAHPVEKPVLPPPAAVLYPLASLPEEVGNMLRETLFSGA